MGPLRVPVAQVQITVVCSALSTLSKPTHQEAVQGKGIGLLCFISTDIRNHPKKGWFQRSNCKSKRKDKKREQVAVVVDVDRCRGNQIRYQLCWSCERLFAVSNLLPEADGRYL